MKTKDLELEVKFNKLVEESTAYVDKNGQRKGKLHVKRIIKSEGKLKIKLWKPSD